MIIFWKFLKVVVCQARKERQLHMQMYPGWSARDNYAQSKEVDFITSKVNITNNIINILIFPTIPQPLERRAGVRAFKFYP